MSEELKQKILEQCERGSNGGEIVKQRALDDIHDLVVMHLTEANALIDTLVEALGRIESADGFAANIAHEALAEAKKRR